MIRSILFLALLSWVPVLGGAEPKKKEDRPVNRLAKESSPYLRQHAHNPVDWYPWGGEAFEKAKKEGKLIFLSIGYSSCHWCHVMERESFDDPEVAEILNKNFVCIKVDREERPDIDDIYMTALNVIGGRGGWPLSMFLTPEGKPIVGGTYWPKKDQKVDDQTLIGFISVLNKILEVYKEKKKELLAQADAIAEKTEAELEGLSRINPLVELNRDLANGAAENLQEQLDPEHGGFRRGRGNAPKFPMPPSLQSLLRHSQRTKNKELSQLVSLTLDKMALGGIYDQIGGGFHRYSTDRTWTVPHFEKMLYDNGQLLELYAEAYSYDPKPLYKQTIEQTIRYLTREMRHPQGGFYAALDADSNGKEGEFYVWTAEELEKILGKADAMLFRAAYGVSGAPNFEEKAYVLRINRSWSEVATDQKMSEEEFRKKIDELKAKVLAAREKRERPFLDTKIITAWNGLTIAGLAMAGKILKNETYVQNAAQAADFILANSRNREGRLYRSYILVEGKVAPQSLGYLDDYAYFVHGLLNLHDATGEAKWLTEAKALTDLTIKWFSGEGKGGFFYTASDHEKLFARPKEYSDGVQPSSNAVVARNLVRLGHKLKDDQYTKLAEKTFRQFAAILKGTPSNAPAMAEALHLYLDLAGEAKGPLPSDPKTEVPANPRSSTDVVKGSLQVGPPNEKGDREIIVNLTIARPWHIYANPPEHDEVELSKTVAELRFDKKTLPIKPQYAPGKAYKDKIEYKIYEEATTIKFLLPKETPADEVRIKIVACTGGANGRCLAPATLSLPIK